MVNLIESLLKTFITIWRIILIKRLREEACYDSAERLFQIKVDIDLNSVDFYIVSDWACKISKYTVDNWALSPWQTPKKLYTSLHLVILFTLAISQRRCVSIVGTTALQQKDVKYELEDELDWKPVEVIQIALFTNRK